MLQIQRQEQVKNFPRETFVEELAQNMGISLGKMRLRLTSGHNPYKLIEDPSIVDITQPHTTYVLLSLIKPQILLEILKDYFPLSVITYHPNRNDLFSFL